MIIQVKHHHLVEKNPAGLRGGAAIVARPIEERKLVISKDTFCKEFDIDQLRDVWYKTSYLLDRKQSGETCAAQRFGNYKNQPLRFGFNPSFTGKMEDLGLNPQRKERSGITAAIIREKGTNGEREMAYALWLAGFDVKDVHMTDLTSGRETLKMYGLQSSAEDSPILMYWVHPKDGPAASATTKKQRRHSIISLPAKIH